MMMKIKQILKIIFYIILINSFENLNTEAHISHYKNLKKIEMEIFRNDKAKWSTSRVGVSASITFIYLSAHLCIFSCKYNRLFSDRKNSEKHTKQTVY